MQPFRTLGPLEGLERDYPTARRVLEAVALGAEPCAREIALLWISEGVPWVFRERPALFVAVRSWLSRQIGIGEKGVTLVGSARLGRSLAPQSIDRPFGPSSDLDLALISSDLFASCEAAFHRWSEDYQTGVEVPKPREARFWEQNQRELPNALRRGFVDTWKIPSRIRYPESQRISDVMWRLKTKLQSTEGAPRVSKASARVYRDWDSFARQVSLNLRTASERGGVALSDPF